MLSLPNEIWIQIINYLDSQRDINSVCRVDRRFHWLFNRYLYQFNVLYWDGDEATARRFLELGVSVNSTFRRSRLSPTRWVSSSADSESRSKGIIPLHIACFEGHQNLVQLFLDKGANPQTRCHNELSPLWLALTSTNEKVSRTISYHIPDIASHLVYSSKRVSPLHLASYLGLATSVRFFLSKGIDINALDLRENTPLHHALASAAYKLGYNPKCFGPQHKIYPASHDEVLETVVALIEAGANINRKGFASRTPKELAFEHKDERVRKLFELVPKQTVSKWAKPKSVHIGRSWMSNPQFSEEQELRSSDSSRIEYQHQIFKVSGLAKREIIRNWVPGSDSRGGHDNSKAVEATSLDGFPFLGRMCDSTSLMGPDLPESTTWCRSKTDTLIANLVKTESEKSFSVSQHHEQVVSFPQLAHNSPEDPLTLSAKNMRKGFREADIPRASAVESVNAIKTAADLATQKGRKPKGRSRWQPLAL